MSTQHDSSMLREHVRWVEDNGMPSEWATFTGEALRQLGYSQGFLFQEIEEKLGIEKGIYVLVVHGHFGGPVTREHWFKVLEFFGMHKVREAHPEIHPDNTRLLRDLVVMRALMNDLENFDNTLRNWGVTPRQFKKALNDISRRKATKVVRNVLKKSLNIDAEAQFDFELTDWVCSIYKKCVGREPSPFLEDSFEYEQWEHSVS